MAIPGMTGGDIPEWLQEWLLGLSGDPVDTQVSPQQTQQYLRPQPLQQQQENNGGDYGSNGDYLGSFDPMSQPQRPLSDLGGMFPNLTAQDFTPEALGNSFIGGVKGFFDEVGAEARGALNDVTNIIEHPFDSLESGVSSVVDSLMPDQIPDWMSDSARQASYTDTGAKVAAGGLSIGIPGIGGLLGGGLQMAANVNSDNVWMRPENYYPGRQRQGAFGGGLFSTESTEDLHRKYAGISQNVQQQQRNYIDELMLTPEGRARAARFTGDPYAQAQQAAFATQQYNAQQVDARTAAIDRQNYENNLGGFQGGGFNDQGGNVGGSSGFDRDNFDGQGMWE